MPRSLDQLLSAYRSLPEWQRWAIDILSVLDRRVSRTKWMDCVNKADIRASNGNRLVFAAWRPVVEALQRKGLVVFEENKVYCAPGIDEAAMRGSDARSLYRWTTAIAAARADLGIDERRYDTWRSYYDKASLERDFRLSIYLNEVEVFARLLGLLDNRYAAGAGSTIQRVFNSPFDADWANSRAKEIRDVAIRRIVESGHRFLDPVQDVIASLRMSEMAQPDWTWEKRLIIRHCLLRGELESAKQRMPADPPSDALWLEGCRSCQQGQYARACDLFELGIRKRRKETRKRVVLMPTFEGSAYVVSLIGSGDSRRLQSAEKYISLAIRKLPETNLYQSFGQAVSLASGKGRRAGLWTPGPRQILGEPPLVRLFVCTAVTWIHKSPAAKAANLILSARGAQLRECYPWAAAEFANLADRRHSEPARAVHERMGTVPMLSAVPDLEPWQRAIGALEGLTSGVGTTARSTAPELRLTWRIADGHLKPFAQKRRKNGGWTLGQAVSLKRLHDRVNVNFLSEQDKRLCKAITRKQTGYGFDYDQAIRALVGHPLVFNASSPQTQVEVLRADPQLRVSRQGSKLRVKLVPSQPEEGAVHAQLESPDRFVVTVFGQRHGEIQSILSPNGIDVPAAGRDRLVHAVSGLSDFVTVHSDIDSSDAEAEEVPADPTTHFNLLPYESGLRVEATVRPLAEQGPVFAPGKGGEVIFATVDGRRLRALRDLSAERRRLNAAIAQCPSLEWATKDSRGWTLPDPESSLNLVDELQQLGDRVAVAWPKGEAFRISQRANPGSLSLKIRSSRDWFGIDGQLNVSSDLVVELRELLKQMDNAHGRFVPIGDGGFLALTDRFRQLIDQLAGCVGRHGRNYRFHRARLPVLEALVEEAGSIKGDSIWQERLRQFRKAQALDPPVPSTLTAELRDYQVQGYRWAARLAAWGAGACLADDMGLGKTLQALTLILSRAPQGPALVVAPTSVCPNWIEEARRFAPTLNPIQFGRGDRALTLDAAGPYDLIVCSYGLLHYEAEGLGGVDWETIVLDEAQAIKNRNTMRSRAAMKLRGAFRMITTGTPIENHLGELWNLFNFTNPGLLGSHKAFEREYANPIHQHDDSGARQSLKRLIQPYMLRRTKSAVLHELPARTQIMIRVKMSERERAFYEALRQRAMDRLEEKESDGLRSHVTILAEIMRLRRSCCHPSLVAPELNIPGAKLQAFAELADELLDNGHKALVFSQFVDHLKIVRSYLDRTGTAYRYLDGGMAPAARKREVDAFQAGDGDIFLMSLRAGGQGLNLTAADYVIHLDPWWNPAVEDQASDRAHRIGQKRPVTIYRLVMANTIEEKIVDLHAKKRDLAADLLEGADMSGRISADELLALIRTS